MMAAAAEYAAMGWPVCAGAYPPGRSRHGEALRACSCDRVGCPDPGAHPVSPAWQAQASVDPRLVTQWWMAQPEGNIILVTGRAIQHCATRRGSAVAWACQAGDIGCAPGSGQPTRSQEQARSASPWRDRPGG